jgi:tRNA-splicing ligase RtcB
VAQQELYFGLTVKKGILIMLNIKNVKSWTENIAVEPAAIEQLYNISKLQILHGHIAVMPDVHWGNGTTVGSVIPTINAIIPAAVGVDIGCGMQALKTSLKSNQLPDNLAHLRNKIERSVPVGFNDHKVDNVPLVVRDSWSQLSSAYDRINDKYNFKIKRNPLHQLGTLGGGNHFIELCLDENENVWVMLHSGSRGIGNKIGSFFITKAKEEIEKQGIKLPDANLAWLTEKTEIFEGYISAVLWAQEYARLNRACMMKLICDELRMYLQPFKIIGEVISCHHNYVQKEYHFDKYVWLTRKGAVSAYKDQLGIIPGSMGTKSYIVKGKGNKDSYCSCSHGAGRAMSRGQAKRSFTVEQHIAATSGVECRKDYGVLDETPLAYKDIDEVIKAQRDLIEVVHILKQVMCIKG